MNKKRDDLKKGWDFPRKTFKWFLFFMAILYVQFVYISLSPVIYGKNLAKFALNRNTYKSTLIANRGIIYDKDGNILAINVSSYNVIAYLDPSRTGSSTTPKHVVDKLETATKLAPVLGMEQETLLAILNKDLYQVELGPGGRGITELKKEEIEALELSGIGFIEQTKRYYPNGDFASYVIGYAKYYEDIKTVDGVSKIDASIVGELGIESKYDDILKGKDGYIEFQRDRFGYKIPDTKETKVDALDGSDVYLTIDSNIQRFLEDAVKETAINYAPEWMLITVMDAKTGDILGSASTPSYNPNLLNIVNYQAPLVSYVFEPGSIMKTYTYMCAIEKGTYDGAKTFKSGQITIGDDTIKDWNKVGWGEITFDKGYEYSSNVGVANIVDSFIDKGDLKTCLNKYGFGQLTDVELMRENTGALNFNYPVEVATAGFGQGITTTPIQQLQALTMIANGGVMLKPHLVSKIIDSQTKDITYNRSVSKSEQLVSTTTIDKMKQLMYNAVNGTDAGTAGKSYQIDGMDIIGKTGTAQVYNPATGKYSTVANDEIYSFTGMFPKEKPEIIIYATMKKPNANRALALSSATKTVIKNIVKYMGIYEDTTNTNVLQKYIVGSYTNKKVADIKASLPLVDLIVIGDGDTVIKQSMSAGSTILANEKLIIITNGSTLTMPTLMGWSRQEAISLLEMLGMKYEINGYGYVVNQSVSSNTIINKEDVVMLTLAKKYDLDVEEEQ